MSVPSSCKALQLQRGAEDSPKPTRHLAVVRTVDVPKEKEGMVLVKIHAAGFNRRDEWAMLGAYPGITFENSTFGCDGVGTVVRGGSSSSSSSSSSSKHPNGLVILVPIRGWLKDEGGPEADMPNAPSHIVQNKLGGKGFGLLGSTKPTGGVGTFCEYIAVEEDMIADVPAHLNAVQAAALPCGGLTAYRALFTKGKLTRGQTVLITGIGGGVALLALQFAVAAGCNVFVTGGTSGKIERAVLMGARGGVEYKDKDWPKKLAKMVVEKSKDRPYLDVVIDSAGGDVPVHAAKAGLKVGGKIVCFGMTAVPKMTFTMREVLRNVDLLGSTMGSADEFRKMLHFVQQHKIVPIIDTVIDGLDNANQGFPLLQDADKRSGGKVIVKLVDDARQSKL